MLHYVSARTDDRKQKIMAMKISAVVSGPWKRKVINSPLLVDIQHPPGKRNVVNSTPSVDNVFNYHQKRWLSSKLSRRQKERMQAMQQKSTQALRIPYFVAAVLASLFHSYTAITSYQISVNKFSMQLYKVVEI